MTRTLPGPIIGPGIYPDLDIDQYHAAAALSSSGLKYVARSMAHYLEYRGTGVDSDAYAIGRAVHSLVLEGGFGDQYAVSEFESFKTKAAREWRDEQREAGKTVLRQGEADAAKFCADAVLAHPRAIEMLRQGTVEQSYFWNDNGVPGRCRPDCYVEGPGIIIDLKTMLDASPLAVRKAIANFGYHRQSAHYKAGVEANDKPVNACMIIAAEKAPPYGVAIYHLHPAWLTRGEAQVIDLVDRVRDWMHRPDTPTGYPDTITLLDMPPWT